MFTIIFFLLYNLIIFPVLFILLHIAAAFNLKFRNGILGRYRVLKDVRKFIAVSGAQNSDIFLFHCASMGEFEHIKPVLRELKDRLPESRAVVMFFSPSGFDNVKSAPGVDLFIYSPFDWWLPLWRFYRLLKPRALIVAKYDAWPNQIWMAKLLGIPRFLINATLYENSSRIKIPLRWFLKTIYSAFDRVMTISGTDRELYTKLIPAEKIVVVGDTKYDQVVFRSEESRRKNVLPENFCDGKTVLICGSTWPEDEIQLVPAIKAVAAEIPDFLAIICPHEPVLAHIEQLKSQFQEFHIRLHSELKESDCQPEDKTVLIIDRIGILANLYSVADAAYVGGSFKQNVHNVLEPAAYGIPVLFGPVNHTSHEAQLLKQNGGGLEVHSGEEITEHLQKIFRDPQTRKGVGEQAKKLVEDKGGATERTLQTMLEVLKIF